MTNLVLLQFFHNDLHHTFSNVCVFHGLPGGGQHIRQIDEILVRWSHRDLDRPEMSLGEPGCTPLGLRAPDHKLGIAEDRRSGVMFADLSRLALGMESLPAHEAAAAADIEGNDHPVPRLDLGHAPID